MVKSSGSRNSCHFFQSQKTWIVPNRHRYGICSSPNDHKFRFQLSRSKGFQRSSSCDWYSSRLQLSLTTFKKDYLRKFLKNFVKKLVELTGKNAWILAIPTDVSKTSIKNDNWSSFSISVNDTRIQAGNYNHEIWPISIEIWVRKKLDLQDR